MEEMILIDTNILIDYLKGNSQAEAFIQKYGKANLIINSIIAMELYQGARNKSEFGKIKKELAGFIMVDINEAISQTALRLEERYAVSHQVSIPDYFIAATALVYDLEIRTHNLKDFRFIPNIKVLNILT
jgi:tRNA(fMet)-specific endonuclease VapC